MLQIIYVGVKLCDRLRAEDARDRLLGQSAALRVSRIRCPNVFIFSVPCSLLAGREGIDFEFIPSEVSLCPTGPGPIFRDY